MKFILRSILFNVFALWLASQIIPGLGVSGSWQIFMLAGITLSVLMLIVKPILKILFIPINFLTFGLLSWLINVAVLYILTLLVPEVQVKTWVFPGLSVGGFIVPQITITYLFSLIIDALAISTLTDILEQISEG